MVDSSTADPGSAVSAYDFGGALRGPGSVVVCVDPWHAGYAAPKMICARIALLDRGGGDRAMLTRVAAPEFVRTLCEQFGLNVVYGPRYPDPAAASRTCLEPAGLAMCNSLRRVQSSCGPAR
jgi:hypothetical protein